MLFSECGSVQGLLFSHVCMCFPPFIESVQGLFCSCLGIISYLNSSFHVFLLCSICFDTVSSLERGSIRKKSSLQYQSGGLTLLDLCFLLFVISYILSVISKYIKWQCIHVVTHLLNTMLLC